MKKTTATELTTPTKCSDLVAAIATSITTIQNASPHAWGRDERMQAVRTIAAYFGMLVIAA